MVLDKFVVMDDVSDLVAKFDEFANFLTVFSKVWYNLCLYFSYCSS